MCVVSCVKLGGAVMTAEIVIVITAAGWAAAFRLT